MKLINEGAHFSAARVSPAASSLLVIDGFHVALREKCRRGASGNDDRDAKNRDCRNRLSEEHRADDGRESNRRELKHRGQEKIPSAECPRKAELRE